MNEWRLIKKIKGLNLGEKVFETDELPQSDKHEAQIDRFTEELKSRDIEIFEVKGHQFITSDGVYTIAHKGEIEYGEE